VLVSETGLVVSVHELRVLSDAAVLDVFANTLNFCVLKPSHEIKQEVLDDNGARTCVFQERWKFYPLFSGNKLSFNCIFVE
jgi:hypothetical protein